MRKTERGLRKGQLKTLEEAKVSPKQHKKPCADCPWARTAVPDWLGGETSGGWVSLVHSDVHIDCHTLLKKKAERHDDRSVDPMEPWQCAGAAIYRANVCKSPRDKTNLELPPDEKLVFSSPQGFLDHHTRKIEK